MTLATLSPKELEPQLAQILDKYREDMEQAPRPVVFHTGARWSGAMSITVKGQRFRVAEARSILQLREALIRHPGDDIPLILTTVDEKELPQDSRARILRYRLFSVDAWEAVKSLFRASVVDPRLRDRAVAEALLAHAPPDGYPPVPAGVLDADSAWRALYRVALGMGPRLPEGRDLLRWASTPDAQLRYGETTEAFRKAVREHLETRLGRIARVVFRVLDAGKSQDIQAFALLCELLDHAWQVDAHLAELVAARAEYLVGNSSLTQEDVKAVALAVRMMLGDSPSNLLETVNFQQLDALIQGLRASDVAHLSDFSPLGLQARLEQLGEALTHRTISMRVAWERVAAIGRHRLTTGNPLLLERCCMLVRLTAWLREGQSASTGTLLHLGRVYLDELMWVDRAREALAAADMGGQLGRATRQVLGQVTAQRATFNRAFGSRLVADLEQETLAPEILPIERVLECVVVPQAKESPVLLIVLDGLSWPVALVLAEELIAARWELMGGFGAQPAVVLATVPTVTEFSRTSLLCGSLKAGQASTEKQGFRTFAPLQAVSRASFPPRLFHKDELTEEGRGGLSSGVRSAILESLQRVVAVVVNAVDDRLKGPQQLDSRWNLEVISPLRSLLEAAAESGRRVILTSDHGYVWEDSSSKLPGGESERWRAPGGALADEELRVRGIRVKTLTGMQEIWVPWSERVRYTLPKAGYHGGVTPQEVLVPLLVALPPKHAAKDLPPLELIAPVWWSEDLAPLPSEVAAPSATKGIEPRSKRVAVPVPGPVLPLFPALSQPPEASSHHPKPPVVPPQSSLLERLLASEVLKLQSRLAGRHVPEPEVLRALLGPLIDHKGRVPVRTLAASLRLPEHRVHGLVTQVARLLNVDGYPILTVDRGENGVRLDLEQLRTQFELKEG